MIVQFAIVWSDIFHNLQATYKQITWSATHLQFRFKDSV